MKPGEKMMTMEEYVNFFLSGKSIDFTISYLNQIVRMHGFRKLHKSKKKNVGKAVDALDLLDLSRSTLKQTDFSSSSAFLSLDEVITDIEALKWQECCFTSLQTINSDEVTRSVAKPKQKSNKRKKANMKKLMKLGDASYGVENESSITLALPKKMRSKTTKNTKSHQILTRYQG